MRKASNAEPVRVAALEGKARQGGASAAGETTRSLRSSAATGNNSSRSGGGPVSRRAGNGGVRTDGQETVPPEGRKSSFTLWLWVAGGFLLLVIAWTIMFTVAHSAKIESVPLTTSGGKSR